MTESYSDFKQYGFPPRNGYRIFLDFRGIHAQLPVNPEAIVTSHGGDNKRYNIVGIGEIIVPRLPKLALFEWESFFPATSSPTYVNTKANFKPPSYYIELIKGFQVDRSLIRLVINRRMDDGSLIFNTNTLAVVESFVTTEKGGETGDFHYKIILSEYRSYAAYMVAYQNTGSTVKAFKLKQRAVDPTVIFLGVNVTVNGPLYSGPDGPEKLLSVSAYRGSVEYIRDGAPYPYRIVSPAGQPQGWAAKTAVQAVSYAGN